MSYDIKPFEPHRSTDKEAINHLYELRKQRAKKVCKNTQQIDKLYEQARQQALGLRDRPLSYKRALDPCCRYPKKGGFLYMLIIPETNEVKTQFRLRISQEVLDEISQYCQWAGIRYRDHFIEQACKYIFANDKDWKNFKKDMEKNDKNSNK